MPDSTFHCVDVSLRTVHLCVIDDQGERVAETKLASDVQDNVAYLDDLELDIDSVGLEAGTLTQYLTDGLQAAGFDIICMQARQVKGALSAMRNKTDKHDARGIAQILRSGWYSQVHVKPGTREEYAEPPHPHVALQSQGRLK
jgi:transposase